MQRQYKILIVDDSEDMRALLGELLEDEGYVIVLADDGQQALAQAALHHPDIILMDISLPGMNGWEVVEQLRACPEFQQTPIVAVTAHATRSDEEHSLSAGCTAHVSKPFDIFAITRQIQTLLMQSSSEG